MRYRTIGTDPKTRREASVLSWTASGCPTRSGSRSRAASAAPLTCLNEARYGIVRGVTGSARSMPQARTRGLSAIGA
ncbi:hypothetical protein [Streptomyces sp. NPDC088246]|uniref:hypothetical protein n=1 Tax=Streptomyces sp. NPDC088246 TaxID=3365842 RepID=UPI003822845C